MRRAYLKYEINLAIMRLNQSDRGVNIPTPAHGNTAKVTRLFSKRVWRLTGVVLLGSVSREFRLTSEPIVEPGLSPVKAKYFY